MESLVLKTKEQGKVMSLKVIKSAVMAGCIGVVTLFTTAANAASTATTTTGLGTLFNDGVALNVGKVYSSETSFTDTYNFSIDSAVSGVSSLIVSSEAAPFIGISDFAVSLYDAGTDTTITKTGSSSYSFSISGLFDVSDIYTLTVSGLVSGSFVGVYGGELSAVPLPAAAWLFISGFLAIGGMSYFKRKREERESFPSGALTA